MSGAFSHRGLLFSTGEEHAVAVVRFVRDEVAEGQPVFVAVPPARIALPCAALGRQA